MKKDISKKDSLTKFEDLPALCQWFNSLKVDIQINILEYIIDKTDDLKTSEEDSEILEEFINKVVRLIVSKDNNQEEILSILTGYGLEKIFANGFYEFCKGIAEPYFDAKIVSRMSKENIRDLSLFILNHMILYQDYTDIPFTKFSKLIGFEKDEDSARGALTFIKSQYFEVCDRKCSVTNLTKLLLNEYEIPEDLVKEIVTPINDNLQEMHQAHLLNQINKILSKISCSYSCLEKGESSEKDLMLKDKL